MGYMQDRRKYDKRRAVNDTGVSRFPKNSSQGLATSLSGLKIPADTPAENILTALLREGLSTNKEHF